MGEDLSQTGQAARLLARLPPLPVREVRYHQQTAERRGDVSAPPTPACTPLSTLTMLPRFYRRPFPRLTTSGRARLKHLHRRGRAVDELVEGGKHRRGDGRRVVLVDVRSGRLERRQCSCWHRGDVGVGGRVAWMSWHGAFFRRQPDASACGEQVCGDSGRQRAAWRVRRVVRGSCYCACEDCGRTILVGLGIGGCNSRTKLVAIDRRHCNAKRHNIFKYTQYTPLSIFFIRRLDR